MSALAKILIANGTSVTGSDITATPITEELEKLGARVTIPHNASCICDQDAVVFTSAVKSDNPEIVEAKKRGIKLIERAEMVGNIMRSSSDAVAVSGTHGKTTTTSMMAYTMLSADLDPTVMVGGELDILNGNLRIGNSGRMVTEACEYCRNFLRFAPTLGIILNVEADHLDYYRDLDDVIDAFSSFAALIPESGALVINSDDPNCAKAAASAKCRVIAAGINNGDIRAEDISYDRFGYPSFTVTENGKEIMRLTLSVVGEHNIYNALCAVAASLVLTDNVSAIKAGLEKFTGTKRRFEKKGEKDGILVVDDYAHHPTEIKATLSAVSKIRSGKVWCVFQPHTYTRTKTLFPDFVKALSAAENLVIADIYAAREKDTGLVSSKELADAIDGAVYIKGFESIADYFMQNASPGDIILTMGAGDIFKVGEIILQKR